MEALSLIWGYKDCLPITFTQILPQICEKNPRAKMQTNTLQFVVCKAYSISKTTQRSHSCIFSNHAWHAETRPLRSLASPGYTYPPTEKIIYTLTLTPQVYKTPKSTLNIPSLEPRSEW